MSRIDKNPIIIPEKTEIKVDGCNVFIKGPLGELCVDINREVKIIAEDGKVAIGKVDEKTSDALRGLTRALIANMFIGVTIGYTKILELEGVGYKVALSGNKLVLQLGFSHPVEVEAEQGISFTVVKNVITVSGIDKALVGQTAANIRKLKKPEPYKGKGIRYQGEVVRRKEGKKAGSA